jgi:hypothetical protein
MRREIENLRKSALGLKVRLFPGDIVEFREERGNAMYVVDMIALDGSPDKTYLEISYGFSSIDRTLTINDDFCNKSFSIHDKLLESPEVGFKGVVRSGDYRKELLRNKAFGRDSCLYPPLPADIVEPRSVREGHQKFFVDTINWRPAEVRLFLENTGTYKWFSLEKDGYSGMEEECTLSRSPNILDLARFTPPSDWAELVCGTCIYSDCSSRGCPVVKEEEEDKV